MATQQTAVTQYVQVGENKIAYRRFGSSKTTTVPLLMIIHLRGTMDHWDPLLINGLALQREVILYDAPGQGHSNGSFPTTADLYAEQLNAFLDAIKVSVVDALGFSMGGFPVQVLAATQPAKVRKLILAGTKSGGSGTGFSNLISSDGIKDGIVPEGTADDPPLRLDPTWHGLLWPLDRPEELKKSQDWWKRIKERNVEGETPSEYVSGENLGNQFAVIGQWSSQDGAERLSAIKQRVLVTNGDNDIIVPTVNSWIMSQQLVNAELQIFPNASHGFLFQYPKTFARRVAEFLDEDLA